MPATPPNRLLILDGHAYAYRAFYAIRSLTSPQGQPTNAIYGFIKMLLKIRGALAPTHAAVIWDGGLAAARMALLPEYKAQRPPMPDDLGPQIDAIRRFLDAAGIASLCHEGVEADDWIGALTARAAAAGFEVIIASSDKDFMQLVAPGIRLLNPNDKTEQLWTDEQVRAKTGVNPAQIVDWLSLVGDAVDNVRGVPGVGPKTAAELLQTFGTIESVYQRLGEVKSERVRGALHASAAVVQRNRQLIRLHDELPAPFDPAALRLGAGDAGRLAALCDEWGFKKLKHELGAEEASQPELLSMN
ncbi:MAG: hypothetical protein HY301_14810 [Verrucomicrobia bacterium]|nr:hypothetical protein [Verrucomicrobiota bacterium]